MLEKDLIEYTLEDVDDGAVNEVKAGSASTNPFLPGFVKAKKENHVEAVQVPDQQVEEPIEAQTSPFDFDLLND